MREHYMGHFDLADELRHLERWGVVVPELSSSQFMPTFSGRSEAGSEVYRHVGHIIELKPGEVIDCHGNVVNLSGLRNQAAIEIARIQPIRNSFDSPDIRSYLSDENANRPDHNFPLGDVYGVNTGPNFESPTDVVEGPFAKYIAALPGQQR